MAEWVAAIRWERRNGRMGGGHTLGAKEWSHAVNIVVMHNC